MAHEEDLRAKHFIAGSTPQITYKLEKEDGQPLDSALTTMTASIYDAKSKAALTDWIDKDILEKEGNTVVGFDTGTWDLPADATGMIGNGAVEDHVIAVTFTYGSGRVGKKWLLIRVHKQPVGS
ncbi:MAG: hypothetical protein V3T08_09600 [Gemmatimonadota bacterium]